MTRDTRALTLLSLRIWKWITNDVNVLVPCQRKKQSLNKRTKLGFSNEEKRALEAALKKHGTSE